MTQHVWVYTLSATRSTSLTLTQSKYYNKLKGQLQQARGNKRACDGNIAEGNFDPQRGTKK